MLSYTVYGKVYTGFALWKSAGHIYDGLLSQAIPADPRLLVVLAWGLLSLDAIWLVDGEEGMASLGRYYGNVVGRMPSFTVLHQERINGFLNSGPPC